MFAVRFREFYFRQYNLTLELVKGKYTEFNTFFNPHSAILNERILTKRLLLKARQLMIYHIFHYPWWYITFSIFSYLSWIKQGNVLYLRFRCQKSMINVMKEIGKQISKKASNSFSGKRKLSPNWLKTTEKII